MPAFAAQTPAAGRLDPRVTSVVYQPNNVVHVFATYGISTMIIFDEDEKFETVALGDTESWDVVPTEKGNILFVKPKAKHVTTNMNVVTDQADLLSRAQRLCAGGRQEGLWHPLRLPRKGSQRLPAQRG